MVERLFHLEIVFTDREDYQDFLRSKPFAQDGSIQLTDCDDSVGMVAITCLQRSLAPLMHVCLASGAIPYVEKPDATYPLTDE